MERIRKADGSRLRQLREDAWLSQSELAQKANIHVVTIHKIETGKDPSPRMSTLLALAKALRVHPDTLLEPREDRDGQEDGRRGPFGITDISPGRERRGVGYGASWDLGSPDAEQSAFQNG